MPTIKKLIIVESPTKGKTIERFLGPDFRVAASFGHIRDLPKSELGVDEKTFEPRYVIPSKARKTIKYLKEQISQAKAVYIATDLDREGEAIGWHIAQVTGLVDTVDKVDKSTHKPLHRIIFHEITKNALLRALEHPRPINQDLVDSQQARRILDRLVGYKLSPLLWKKVARGLSAGRVQSVAVRLIIEREREIENFKPQEYWTIEAELEKDALKFIALLVEKDGEKIGKLDIPSEKEATAYIRDLSGVKYHVRDIKTATITKLPYPPFTTSTLQQEAARQFGWSASETMRNAQSLYERGYITYHRTDSLTLSWSAIGLARKVIEKRFGQKFLPKAGRQFKTRTRGAQEAHEAIRPSYPDRIPDSVDLSDPALRKLYDLIWRRFIASQMAAAEIAQTTVDISAKKFLFRAVGTKITFDGFLAVWPMKIEEKELPPLMVGDPLELITLNPQQHFTEPPPRYNMASLIKTLEEYGIGRPSTYAPIIQTIIDRNYVGANRGVFFPTDLGFVVTDLLVRHFPEIVDIAFTASMEEDLDRVAVGHRRWTQVLEDFYRPFSATLAKKQSEIQKADLQEELSEKCPESGHPLVIKVGRYGKFIACTGFPECKYTRPLTIELDLSCPECGQGKVIERKTRRGATFWGCTNYPSCSWATWTKPALAVNQQKTNDN